ncbi:MAG: hypothetical protein QOI10_3918, partial [Solirubrobacterales bacterium]|nr:hypothetical protein [Solirubrobacterales bacterium]
ASTDRAAVFLSGSYSSIEPVRNDDIETASRKIDQRARQPGADLVQAPAGCPGEQSGSLSPGRHHGHSSGSVGLSIPELVDLTAGSGDELDAIPLMHPGEAVP